jgi:hypothetical protein
MARQNYVRRPWVNYWQQIRYDDKQVDQQCKLIRNLVASMDLGLPGFNLYDSKKGRKDGTPFPTNGREAYLDWVKEWKATYQELSECIRDLKSQRKLVKFLEIREKIEKFTGDNRTNLDQLNTNTYGRVNPTIDALRISAQIMLNARAIGKLASAQLRQRAWEARQRETTAEVELAA